MDCYPSLINHKSYHDMSNITLDLLTKFLRNEKKKNVKVNLQIEEDSVEIV